MARTSLPTYSRIASYMSGYTQHCDVPLRRVRTLDLDFEASLAKEVGYFSGFLPAMASDHTAMNYYRAYSITY